MNLLDNNEVFVELKVLPHGEKWYGEIDKQANTPAPATEGSAAVDLYSMDDVIIKPGQCLPIATGICIHMRSPNVCGLVLPRSGLGAKQGLVLGNTAGLIDNDYQGELTCYVLNRNSFSADGSRVPDLHITPGMKFAQLMFLPFLSPRFMRVTEFSATTQRGTGGFGSTG